MVRSSRGFIDNKLWSMLEADGLAAQGIRTYIKSNGGCRIAVWRGDPEDDIDVVYVPKLIRKS